MDALEQPVFRESAVHTNVGSIDRIVRIVLGLALILVPLIPNIPLFTNAAAFWGALIVGLILIVTAIVRFCPLYTLFGLSTRKVSR